jgi:hypothetical protein
VHVHAEDLQSAGEPLHVLDQLRVPRVRADLLRGPVGERVGARAHQPEAAALGRVADLLDRRGEVADGFVGGRADTGDDLDARLEQLVLGLRVLAAMGRPELGEDLARRTAGRQLAGLEVDELELPLDAEAGPRRRRERDLHARRLPTRAAA